MSSSLFPPTLSIMYFMCLWTLDSLVSCILRLFLCCERVSQDDQCYDCRCRSSSQFHFKKRTFETWFPSEGLLMSLWRCPYVLLLESTAQVSRERRSWQMSSCWSEDQMRKRTAVSGLTGNKKIWLLYSMSSFELEKKKLMKENCTAGGRVTWRTKWKGSHFAAVFLKSSPCLSYWLVVCVWSSRFRTRCLPRIKFRLSSSLWLMLSLNRETLSAFDSFGESDRSLLHSRTCTRQTKGVENILKDLLCFLKEWQQQRYLKSETMTVVVDLFSSIKRRESLVVFVGFFASSWIPENYCCSWSAFSTKTG